MAEPNLPQKPSIREFPALKNLSWARKKRIPYVQQMENADCSAASLTMILRFYGRHTRLDEARQVIGLGRDGADAASILRAADHFGLKARGLKMDIDDLVHLPTASILHWEMNHFLVFERCDREGVHLVDPAKGRRRVTWEQFKRSFTGVAIVIEPSEKFAPIRAEGNKTWAYLKAMLSERSTMLRIFSISVLLRVFALALPVLTALVVDRVVPRSDYNLLLVISLGLGMMVLFQTVSQLIRAHLLLELRTSLDTRLTLGFLDHLVNLPYAFFQTRSAGDLMMRVNSNQQMREILASSTLSALLDGVLVLVYLLLLFLASTNLGLLVLGLGAAQMCVFLFSRRKYRELMSSELEASSKSQSYLVQLIGGIQSLKIAGAERDAVRRWSNLYASSLNVSLQRGRLQALLDSLSGTLEMASPLIILAYGAIMAMRGEVSLGTMLALNALANGFLTPLGTLVDSAIALQGLESYVERIDDVLANDREQDREKVTQAPRLTGAVELREVSFKYNPTAPNTVKNTSLVIPAGATVALVGKSGSGKSTLANLLLALYWPNEGNIYYDGQSLRDLDVQSVRRQMGIVPQTPYIFSGSLRENILLGDPSGDMRRVVRAAKLACIHDDIMAMPMGYETLVSEGGGSISGGQRQRLALARALAHEPSMLLLDEATSALDSATEAAIMRNLNALDCTRIIIAHRLSTIRNADLIVVVDDGKVIETGSHAELVALGGKYAALIQAQTEMDRSASAGNLEPVPARRSA